MADIKILNLDEFIGNQAERVVIWKGKRHPVAGMTGHAQLKFFQARGMLDRAQKDGDEGQQMTQNLKIIGIVAPTLAEMEDELLDLKLPALNALVQFILGEITDLNTPAADTDQPPVGGGNQPPGE